MKYRIHFSYQFQGQNFENYYDIEGDTIGDIQEKNNKEMAKRGLDMDKNNCWSEAIEGRKQMPAPDRRKGRIPHAAMSKLYRKKPVVIEAMQFDGSPKSFEDVGFFCGQAAIYAEIDHEKTIAIKTLEGTSYNVAKGDFIIKGVKGEFYPCKPDIFQATYEEAQQ